jgi:Ricin-type beta-trefoil lectin domain-like
MPSGKVELRLPLITIGVSDITSNPFRRRRRGGPYVIVSRGCGRALDTHGQQGGLDWPHLEPVTGNINQRWQLVRTKHRGELLIRSIANGLVLDSTRNGVGLKSNNFVMYERNLTDDPWQRWLLEPAPNGFAARIRTAHGTRFLTASAAAEEHAWFDSEGQYIEHEWLVLQPHRLRSRFDGDTLS